MPAAAAQDSPRIDEDENYGGMLDDARLAPHQQRIPSERLIEIITDAVKNANRKASRAILNIPDSSSDEQMRKIYLREGRSLFDYFRRYCGGPPSTAYQCYKRHYSEVAKEQFRNRTLQKERMNSGWRYQFMAHDCAQASGRFLTVSQLATAEADFNVTIATQNFRRRKINIYVSVKNRTNTMGGQDWPKAIAALEAMAKNDQNRADPYLCAFGIAMERGTRLMKARRGGNYYYSGH